MVWFKNNIPFVITQIIAVLFIVSSLSGKLSRIETELCFTQKQTERLEKSNTVVSSELRMLRIELYKTRETLCTMQGKMEK